MCLAIPGKINKIQGRQAWVKYPTETRPALIGESDLKVGDYVMVQMGIIVKKLNAQEAQSASQAWEV